MPLITLDVPQSAVDKARALCNTLGVHSISQLFDQMVEELEWNCYYAPPVRAALLASRVPGRTAAPQNGTQIPGDESVNSTSKE